ncbi:uncharacterized protein LOC110092754 [Dendrobium catenatum]|uniref:uncharacterized protein LOC110092754 n=1 Tax=Dendrobium catenatum TaxID=906689 RepID=UPI0009F2CBED|nr:uncharacterized protein LOC110092754 [Dendrobium catenatum]
MRCRTHPSDSGIGVCPFCLRERLSSLAVADSSNGHVETSSPENHWDPDRSSAPRAPTPLLCHLSPFSNAAGKNRAVGKFSLLSPIWGSNPGPKKAESGAGLSKPSGSNNSWLLALNLGRRKRNKRASPHVQPVSGRGMSPAAELSPGRGVSIPSPMWRQQSPRRLSSFGLCLSPMVRPIPANRRGHAPPETSFPSEKRGTFNRRCGSGGGAVVHELSPCLMANRSRKLVDFGRIVW